MSKQKGVRTKPAMASGFVASLQIAPRDYHYTVCPACDRRLYFTHVGEDCPHCGARVTVFVEGTVPPLDRMAEACLAAAGAGSGGGISPATSPRAGEGALPRRARPRRGGGAGEGFSAPPPRRGGAA